MGTPEAPQKIEEPTVENILAEMTSLPAPPSPIPEFPSDMVMAAVGGRRYQLLERRFYMPFNYKFGGLESVRMRRLQPGFYRLICLDFMGGEVILQRGAKKIKVRPPPTMEWPWWPKNATHLHVGSRGPKLGRRSFKWISCK